MASTPKETTTKTEPWDGAKPYLTEYYQKADELFDKGMPQYYQGSTVADQSSATKDAIAAQEAIARSGQGTAGLANAQSAVANIAGGAGYPSQAQNTLSRLQNSTTAGTNPAAAGVAGLSGNKTAPGSATLNAGMNYSNPGVAATQQVMAGINSNFVNPATQQAANANNFTNSASGLQQQQAQNLASASNPVLANLMATASGQNVGKNPYLDQMVANQQTKIADQLKNVTMPGISSQANMLGRSGSNAFASQLNNATSTAADAMSKAATDMYGAQYNTDVQNQLSANQQVGNFYNSDQQNQLAANSALSNTSNTQQGQRLAGTELYGNLNNTQAGLRNDASSLALQGAGQLGQQATTEQGLRMDAANAANSQNNTELQRQLAALGLQSDMFNQDVNNGLNNSKLQLDAANSQAGNANAAANTQLAAAGMAGDTYGYNYLPSSQLAQIGAAQDARSQDVLNAQIQKHDFEQTQPIRNIADMINMVNGGGYNNQTTPVYSNTAGQMLGGLSSLVGLLSLCDERTKHILRHVGFMPVADGSTIPMYEFTYKDDPEQKTWIGPMAQEVEEVIPDAVIEIGGIKHIITDTFMEAA